MPGAAHGVLRGPRVRGAAGAGSGRAGARRGGWARPFRPRGRVLATESSWHRRARRARQAARGVLAIANARTLLAAHHGGGMAGGAKGGKGGAHTCGDGAARDAAVRYEDWRCSLCSFRNYGWRPKCKRCEAYPPGGQRVPKGAGKGDRGGSSATGGGIASRQLQQAEQARRDQQRSLDLLRNESKKDKQEVERLRKLLAAKGSAVAEGGATAVEIGGDDDEDEVDDGDADKIQVLASEVKHLETLLKGLPDAVAFKTLSKKRLDEARAELQALREQREGPEARVLGVAGKHQRELRATRSRLLKKSKAQERIEAEVDELEEQIGGLQERLKTKQADLQKAREEVRLAHDELQRLTSASAAAGCADGESAGADGTGDDQRTNAERLVCQLAALLGPAAAVHLNALQEAARLQAAQQQQVAAAAAAAAAAADLSRQQLGAPAAAAVAAAAASAPATPGGPPQPPPQTSIVPPVQVQAAAASTDGDGADMEDLDEETVELLGVAGAVLDAAAEGGLLTADSTAGGSNKRRAALVEHLKKRGSSSSRLQGVIKDLKSKKAKADAKAAAAAAAAASSAKAAAEGEQEAATQGA